ncbi:autotransporter domain-containing protein [Enterobacter sp. SGAir0187]|uniref:BigA/YdbA N-terminal beta-barrel domain-containing protein n=1 Tax=Enterobacter sp. SGAir0187 TaxID=2836161 RepID=UPI000CEB7C3E|nr:autotransporter domain-containing protein [Enterobacter sp. SGAir0187]AVH18405.1 autotransporter domain-containing protein [Enterobacter sp. SGAir0187]
MQKKRILAACIAVALQSPVYAATTIDDTTEETNCTASDNASLNQEEKNKLAEQCRQQSSEEWGWLAGGVAAVGAAVGAIVYNDDDSHHDSNTSVPPDDGGDVTPVPPDDGGDITPTPPDDTSVVSFSNGVTLDKGADTLHFDDIKLDNGEKLGPATLSYTGQDNQWQLNTQDGQTLLVADWNVTKTQAAVIEGTQNGLYWKYDSKGYLILADENTQVLSGEGETHTTDRGLDVNGQNNTGVIISGDKTHNTLSGDSTVSNGATGLVISGDNTVNTISGQSTVDGATGALISGDDSVTHISGGINVSGGGTALIIDGDKVTVDNTGTSNISGQGSTGSIITGDNAHISNDGHMTITDGGTGGKITGDGTVIDNKGDSTVSGNGSIALILDGDNSIVINEGNQTVSDGGVSEYINGDNARLINTGDINVDGAGSAGVVVNGNDANLTQNGDLLITNGALGIILYGEGNKSTNDGHTVVRDENSVGFVVAGKQNSFNNKGDINVSLNGTGTLVSGDNSLVNLSGDINVNSEQDDSGVYRGATGISVTGNHTTTNIVGNATLNGAYAADSLMAYSDTLTGISIIGDDNELDLVGTLGINIEDLSAIDGQLLNTTGFDIQGDGNIVNITGGVDINYSASPDSYMSSVIGINVSGNSDVTLSGESNITTTDIEGGSVSLARVTNGGSLVLDENSVMSADINTLYSYFDNTSNALLLASGTGSSIDNKGIIDASGTMFFIRATDGAQGKNSGDITVVTNDNTYATSAIMAASDSKESVVENAAGGSIAVTTGSTPSYLGEHTGDPMYPMDPYTNIIYGMLAYDNATAINDVGASISMSGAGVYGMGATIGTVQNAGDIYIDGFARTLDSDGNITDEYFWDTNHVELPSAGMVAGTDMTYRSGDATAINTGTITVNNAGYGMTAMSGGTAINQGTINLTADEGISGEENQLVGMAALYGGVVINDTTGTINIDADYGQAFYTDGSGYIINNGAINLNGSPMDESDTHMGSTPTDQVWLQALAGSGESLDKTSATGFFTSEALANYGTATINGDVDANGWLYNEADAHLTVNGELLVNTGGLENQGGLETSTLSSWGNVYNRDSGSITTDLLTLNGNTTFFNDGDFTGSIAATSYQQEIVNTGNMTVAEDGKSLASGSFYFYNQEGATLSNSGSATEGGENTIINMTRANDSLTQVNSGTITATNGYSAITTANGSNSPKWIWNTETGVINGINPDAPLINLGRGYNFGNEGTINIQGDNAVAISGGTSSYEINLVNSGTINVGTEQGKADGTNGTGLIGIKGNGKDTTINNTADGVINVYADDSYAFGGQTKAIINNGEINLLCDSGCDIYAPGTTGTQHNADGTADIVIPDAATAPAQGNVPTPPADPNAPQMLSNYIVGTNADGSSGTLKANNLVIGDNVKVGTGFTAGTADTTVVVDNAFTGSNIQGAENITSTSVVWNAQGSNDANGNVDVTMTKNAYADVATDSSVGSVAQALDAGYTNNELYTSLNVGTSAELNSALKQVSGSQATTVFREARVMSNRFTMLADAAPQVGDGLAFNVVAKGDPRAELGNDTQYDMLALRQKLDLTDRQSLTLEYGIARIDGNGANTAGDNGVTGGYSQFFGLKHKLALNDDGLSWNNALRYDVHNLDSSRLVSYGDVNKVADSDARQQYLEFRSEGAKTFTMLDDALNITPYAGVKVRHTLEDGYQERSAGDFNLSMNAGSETAVDAIAGLTLNYAGKNSWGASATLEGGPNLSYSKNQRYATLQGAAGQQFNVDDGQQGGGVNGMATVGVKYNAYETSLNLDAYQWKEDGISDKGFMFSVKKTF